MLRRLLLCAVLAVSAMNVSAADRSLRWSSAGDVLTFDIHAASDSFSQNLAGQIYEQLVRRGKDTLFEPALAESWEIENPLLEPGAARGDG